VITELTEKNKYSLNEINTDWFPTRIILSSNLFVQLAGGTDLYEMEEINNSIKALPVEKWFYKTKLTIESIENDTPVFCPCIGNFL
jgi:hypothetical protein